MSQLSLSTCSHVPVPVSLVLFLSDRDGDERCDVVDHLARVDEALVGQHLGVALLLQLDLGRGRREGEGDEKGTNARERGAGGQREHHQAGRERDAWESLKGGAVEPRVCLLV